MGKCGCTVRFDSREKDKVKFVQKAWIQYCPLHAAAPELLEILKQIVEFLGYNPKSPMYLRMKKIISRATAKESA